MKRAAPCVLLALLLVPGTAAQSDVTIHGLVHNELKAPAANVTVEFVAPNSGQQITYTTNASGRFVAQVPAGEYRVRTYMPNATGELWHDRSLGLIQSTTFQAPLVLNRTEPHMPRAPSFSPTSNPNQTGNTTSRGTDVIARVPLRYEGPGANRTVRVEAEIRYVNGTLLQQSILGNTTLQAGLNNVFAAPVQAAGADPYHAREQRVLLTFRLYDDKNGTLLDAIERVSLTVQDECSGNHIAVTLRLTGATRTLCVAGAEEAQWNAWADQARQVQATDATWAATARSNGTRWTGLEARGFWTSFESTTRAPRASVLAPLDRAQTDTVGQPRWGELQALRDLVEANRTIVREAVHGAIEREQARLSSSEDVARIQAAATILGASLVASAVGVAAATLIVRSWKQRTEYWIGYSAKGQARNPVAWLALAGTLCLVIGAGIAFALGGTDWIQGLRGATP